MIQIREVSLRSRAVLAPMEGVTDLAFRRLIRQVGGCGMTWTEFVPAAGLAESHRRAVATAEIDPDERPVAIQLYGRDPELMADGARYAQDLGATVVDVNFGCPSKKVCAHSGGSALLRSPDLARQIVAAVRAAVSVPFTVKMRAGWDQATKNAPDIAWMCQEEGVDAVTVHWRTRADLYGGERDPGIIRVVVDRVRIPVLANGDVLDGASALQMLAETGAAGVMVGRGAVRNPWVFLEIEAALAGRPAPVVDLAERERVLIGYFERLRSSYRSDAGALGRIKKLARYFPGGVREGEALRDALWHSGTVEDALDRTRAFFAHAQEAACSA